MSEKEDAKLGSVDVGIALPGGGGAHVKLDANEALAKYVRPELYRAQVAFDTLIRGIHLRQDRGEALSPQDNMILAVSAMPILSGKLDNIAAIIEYAKAVDPDFGKYVNGKVPMSEPPKALPSGNADEGLDIDITVEEQEREYWWDRFWGDAEVVTADYMRRLLGKISARKSRNPKSVSLRTIDVLRCLEASTLEDFEKMCRFTLGRQGVPKFDGFSKAYREIDLNFSKALELQEAGLITLAEASMGFRDIRIGQATVRAVIAEGQAAEDDGQARLPLIPFTNAGLELAKLFTYEVNAAETETLLRYVVRYANYRVEWRPTADAPFDPVELHLRPLANVAPDPTKAGED